MTLSEEIDRCERETEACRLAGENPELTPKQKLGAILGEVDWLVAKQIVEAEVGKNGTRVHNDYDNL